jgi:hypothetical protein
MVSRKNRIAESGRRVGSSLSRSSRQAPAASRKENSAFSRPEAFQTTKGVCSASARGASRAKPGEAASGRRRRVRL